MRVQYLYKRYRKVTESQSLVKYGFQTLKQRQRASFSQAQKKAADSKIQTIKMGRKPRSYCDLAALDERVGQLHGLPRSGYPPSDT